MAVSATGGLAASMAIGKGLPRVRLGDVLVPLHCARWRPTIPVEAERRSPDHCLVIGSGQVADYRLTGNEGWSSYEAIAGAFPRAEERKSGGTRMTALPRELVNANVKIVIRDQFPRLQCVLVSERIYPKRAWIGTLAPGWDYEMAYLIVGILNSAVGQALYRQLAGKDESRTLEKSVLVDIGIPLSSGDREAFHRTALLSYRLHCLYEASRDCNIDLVPHVKTHRDQLWHDVVKLYGWTKQQAWELLRGVRRSPDMPTSQEALFDEPLNPLADITLVGKTDLERFEDLKAKARARLITPEEIHSVQQLERRLRWQDRLNGPIPLYLGPSRWPGASTETDAVKAALRYLSERRGQRFGAHLAHRASNRHWEVAVFYSPPRNLKPEDAAQLPKGWEVPGKHAAGKLRVDAITGEVTDITGDTTYARAPQP